MRVLSFFTMLMLGMLITSGVYAQKEGYGDDQNSGGKPDAGNSPVPTNATEARDGVYDKVAINERQTLNYDHIREADVFWQKRVWRIIDTKQKMNHTFSAPKQSFISVLLDIVDKHPDARIYMDDSFKDAKTKVDVERGLGTADTIRVIDPETYEEKVTVVKNDFDWSTVTKFRIKEDWVFDKESSTMVVRILGIAPIREVIDKNTGDSRGTEAMFWMYYPDFRDYLIKYEVFSDENDAVRMTWDDILEMRYFTSYIYKESNMQDRRIQDYATGRDALLESERIKDEIFRKEHNLWEW